MALGYPLCLKSVLFRFTCFYGRAFAVGKFDVIQTFSDVVDRFVLLDGDGLFSAQDEAPQRRCLDALMPH